MLHFQNDESQLDLDIVCYELNDYDQGDSDDRNWLVLRATFIEDDVLLKDSNSCLLTYELKAMAAGLKVLCAGILDRYDSDFTAPYFLLSAWAISEDTFTVGVSFTLPNTMDGNDVATLEVDMTQSELKKLVDELDRYCAKFPERT